MDREQRVVDPGEHRDVLRVSAIGEPALDDPRTGRTGAVRPTLDDFEVGRCAVASRSRSDGFVDSSVAVAKEVGCGVDYGRGAPVVDLEGVLGGPREPLLEVDEISRVGTGVPVDHLVVVADAEHL